MSAAVFEGIKVADFSWAFAGPFMTRYLGIFGATVVRVESPSRPCPIRTSSPYKDKVPGINRSGYWAFLNGSKYSMSLNLNCSAGLEVARRLVAWSDIVVENFRPGIMEGFGLGYEDLIKVKSDVIMLRSSNLGQTGPDAEQPGYGNQLVAFAGFAHFLGWPDRQPLTLAMAYTDTIAPRFGLALLAAALDYRRRTGKGQMIDISQVEPSLYFLAPALLDYSVNGREGGREGNSCPYAAPHGVYRCVGDERWCAISVFSSEEWRAFCQVIGNPSWTEDPKFATLLGRKENEDELNRLVEAWTLNFTAEEVMCRMQANGVSAGVVKTAQDIYNDPQLKLRDHLCKLEHKEIGLVSHLGGNFILSKTPAEPTSPAPCLGEHTEYVCTHFLDMSDKEFVKFMEEGVFD